MESIIWQRNWDFLGCVLLLLVKQQPLSLVYLGKVLNNVCIAMCISAVRSEKHLGLYVMLTRKKKKYNRIAPSPLKSLLNLPPKVN